MKEAVINEVKAYAFPDGEYLVVGSAVLSVLGIRKHADIDLLASRELHDSLREQGWKEGKEATETVGHVVSPDGRIDVITAFSWLEGSPGVEDFLPNAFVVDGVPFMALLDLRRSKHALGREKDKRDIELIDAYLAQHGS